LCFDELPGELDVSVVENSCFGEGIWEAATCLHGTMKTCGLFSKSYIGHWSCLWLVAGVCAIKSYRTVQRSIQKN